MHGERTVLSGAAPAALSFQSAKARKRQTLGGEGEERASKIQKGFSAPVGGGGGHASSHGKSPGIRSAKGVVPPKLLSANLSKSSSLAELWTHVSTSIGDFNAIHCCVALRALREIVEGGRDGDQDERAWIASNVWKRAGEVAGALDKRNLLSVFENAAAIGAAPHPAAALEAILRRALIIAIEFSLEDTISLFSSISRMVAISLFSSISKMAGSSNRDSSTRFCTRGSERLLEDVLYKALDGVSGFTAASIVRLMKVLADAQLVIPQPSWVAMQAAAVTTPNFDARGVATLMRALAEMGTRPGAPLWEVLRKRAVQMADEFEPEDIAELMWAVNPEP